MEVKVERRKHTRKLLDPIHVANIETVDQHMLIAHYGTLLNASASGFLIHINRRDLNPDLREYEPLLAACKGIDVIMKIVEMELKIDARVVRICRIDETSYEIAVDFAGMAPDYWCECLAELMPHVGEIEQIDPLTKPHS